MNAAVRSRLRHWWRKEIRPLLVLALVLLSLRSSLADWNDVPTGSMRPTILEGDRVYVNKLAYDLKVPFTTWHLAQWGNPTRGDVVVFYSPHDGTRLVKRVVGMPGDTVELRHGRLILNGHAVDYGPPAPDAVRDVTFADRIREEYATEQLPGRNHVVAAMPGVPAVRDFGPVQVAADHYFMMGDNRDNSFDSRFWGAVERSRILGRATGVALSFDRSHCWLPRWSRFFSALDR
jgi:signal peptidase I